MEDKTFEQKMLRLEEIVAKLEKGDVPLSDSLALFEEGTGLAASCRTQLDRAEHKYKAAQIGAAEQTDDRIDKVFGQRGDNAGESAADDNTDGHVHHVAAQREGFELFDKLFHFYIPLSI